MLIMLIIWRSAELGVNMWLEYLWGGVIHKGKSLGQSQNDKILKIFRLC